MSSAERQAADERSPIVLSRGDLLKVVSHPLRLDVLSALTRGPGSPATVARTIGCSVDEARYQFKVLDGMHLLEAVDDDRKVRDHQQFYRLGEIRFESLQFDLLPPVAQHGIFAAVLEWFTEAVRSAIESESINTRWPYTLEARPCLFDEEGLEAADCVLRDANEELELISSESRIRLNAASAPVAIHSILGLALFEAADAVNF